MKNTRFLSAGVMLVASVVPAQAVEFGVFADINYNDSSQTGGTNAFALGNLDLYARKLIDEKTYAFLELVFENDGSQYVFELERLWVKRSLNDNLNISAGRFHTPLGYWNRTYHHGALLYDTATRPAFLDFEDSASAILPLHFVGVLFDGEVQTHNGALAYEIQLGNGPSYNTSSGYGGGEIEVNNVSDQNRSKSPGARITYSFDNMPLALGLAVMSNRLAESGLSGNASGIIAGQTLVQQLITAADLEYSGDKFDLMAEYYNLKNDDRFGAAGSHTGNAYYIQMGYQITKSLKPVYRYESVNFDNNDAYFLILNRKQESRHLAALRYDLSETNVLKFQAMSVNPKTGGSYNEYAVQWAFLIP